MKDSLLPIEVMLAIAAGALLSIAFDMVRIGNVLARLVH